MIRYFTRRYLLKVLNRLLRTKEDRIVATVKTVARYERIVKDVLELLDSLKAKIADGNLTFDEIDAIAEEGRCLIDSLFKKE